MTPKGKHERGLQSELNLLAFKSKSNYLFLQNMPHKITVIQLYAPTSNAEKAKVEWFYEDLQDLLKLTP